MKNIVELILTTWNSESKFDENKRIVLTKHNFLCTLSGGQDSVFTFFFLLHISKQKYFQVLYCQHFWQIKNFFLAKFIFELCFLTKVPYTLILPKNFSLTENESREWRNKNFYRFSQLEFVLFNITGQTKTDTLEKNLNNFVRGTSPTSISFNSFLKFQNKTSIFFSTLNLNCCYFYKINGKNQLNQIPFFRFPYTNFSTCIRYQKKLYTFFLKNLTNRVVLLHWKKLKTEENSDLSLNAIKFKKKIKKKIAIGKKQFQFSKPIKKTKCLFFNPNKLKLKNEIFENNFTNLHLWHKKKSTLLQKTSLTKCKRLVFRNRSNKIYSSSFCFSNTFSTRKLPVIKPLFTLNRANVYNLLKLYNLPLFIDITNFSFNFSRNKIRHQLIPFIRFLIDLKSENVIIHFFEILKHQHQDRKSEFRKIYYLFKILNYQFLIKNLIHSISDSQLKNFIQKSFFEYKNLFLTYLQILKLTFFIKVKF